jgi:hypothetical protein
LGGVVDVPRAGDVLEPKDEAKQAAPPAPTTAQHHDGQQAGQKHRGRLLRQQRQAAQHAGEYRHPDPLEAAGLKDRPYAHRHHRRLGRIEVELVHHRDEHRRPQGDQPGKEPRPGAGDDLADAVATEGKQRHEHDVRSEDHRHRMDSDQVNRQRAEQVDQRRVGVVVSERVRQMPAGHLCLVDDRVDHVDATVEVRHPVVLRQPPE